MNVSDLPADDAFQWPPLIAVIIMVVLLTAAVFIPIVLDRPRNNYDKFLITAFSMALTIAAFAFWGGLRDTDNGQERAVMLGEFVSDTYGVDVADSALEEFEQHRTATLRGPDDQIYTLTVLSDGEIVLVDEQQREAPHA